MTSNQDWWPDQLNLQPLRRNSALSDPMGADFDYAAAVASLDVEALKQDIEQVMTTSQDWWPADYGHYGPLFIRMTWHAAGTYRISDGRGGGGAGYQRFAPLNSWPDNASLDKARRLLWPVKQKYGRALSWADLIIFAGNCALESMGFKTFGFAFGRADVWEADATDWGSEGTWLGDERHADDGEIEGPFGADHMGLIYVNPEGPNANPDPLAAARYIRQTFKRMAMNDEETVALIAGGHTFGKAHGAVGEEHVGPEPEGAGIEEQGFGWRNRAGSGAGVDTVTSGLEGAWTDNPVRWDNNFFENLHGHEWELVREPGREVAVRAGRRVRRRHRARRARPGEVASPDDAHDRPLAAHGPRLRPHRAALPGAPGRVRGRLRAGLVQADPPRHGPPQPLPGAAGPRRAAAVAGPGPRCRPRAGRGGGCRRAQAARAQRGPAGLAAGRGRLGLGGVVPRHRQARRRERGAHPPRAAAGLGGQQPGPASRRCSTRWRRSGRSSTTPRAGGTRISLADLIVLAGGAAVEQAARDAGHDVEVPFTPGRTDASQEWTDEESFAVLEPTFDGFRNYLQAGQSGTAEELLVERAELLTLTAPEMTALVGGLRVLNANTGGAAHGVFTDRPGALSNDFFVHLLDMDTEWSASAASPGVFEGRDRGSGQVKWTGTRVDLVFGSNSELRALAEVYGCDDAEPVFVRDFVAAWAKVMNLDRYDVG